MSFENEGGSSLHKASEMLCEPQKQAKISYTREFLLSLSGLDICKKLPSDADRSILSDLEVDPYVIEDRHRISGSLPLQGFRRSEYGSSPPTKGDSGNFSRGIYGRWENRSSSRSDGESDSLPDWDSDSGRLHANQSWRSWQSPEHDGLLGSGSFPRPSSYSAGISAPKVRANDHYQLNKSNEPYHPPRPYKALSHLRRETNDSYNDETFGSAECTSQNRAEEERRRRASFEMMRKEQCKALQEKKKIGGDNKRDNSLSDVSVLPEESKEERRNIDNNAELDVSTAGPVPFAESAKSSLLSQTPASRPLVPPGFRSTGIERNTFVKSSRHNDLTEIRNPDSEEGLLHPVRNNQEERQLTHEMKLNDHQAEDNSEVIELNANDVTVHRIESNQDNSQSILDKIFSSALTVNIGGGSSIIENHGNKQDDTWGPGMVQSSKFAHWFLEEEKKPMDDPSFNWPSDLLSLILGGEKGGSPASDGKGALQILPEASSSPKLPNSLIASNVPPTTAGTSEKLYNGVEQDAVPVVLTCEDLEQTILSEYGERSFTLKQPMQGWNVSGVNNEQAKVDANDHASQHLLSLLQKGVGLTSPTKEDSGPIDKLQVSEVGRMGTVFGKPKEANGESIQHSGKALTLETLFGTAFMKELQSVEAPVSVQRGSVNSARGDVLDPHGLSLSGVDDNLFSNAINGSGSNKGSYEGSALISKTSRRMKLEKVDNFLGFDNQIEVDSSQVQNEAASNHVGFDGPVEFQLPEEESLFSIGNSLNPSDSMFMPAGNATKREHLSLNRSIDISEKLAALNVAFKDEPSAAGQEVPPFVRGPYDLMEPEVAYRNLHAQTSPPQFQPQQINHGRPLYHPLDSHPTHINSQMKFMALDSIPQNEGTPNHQFPPNMVRSLFPPPDTGLLGSDLPAHHSMLQQIQMPGTYPPPHLLHEFRRGGQLPHPSSQAAGFMQEPNPVQVFPYNQRQPNIGGLGMPIPAPDVNNGGHHAEAFQRLMEMELTNAKQIHPFAGGLSQGIYGQELDLGFRYR